MTIQHLPAPTATGSRLGIKDRRSFSPWQLAALVALFAAVGAVIGRSGEATDKGGERVPAFTLPPRAGSQPAGTVVAVDGATASAPSAAQPATASPTGPQVVLVANVNGTGDAALPAFDAPGSWQIGWAYRCVTAPGGQGPFQVFVVPDGGTRPGTAAVDETGRSGDSVTAQESAGRRHLEVHTDPACDWAVKVTTAPSQT